MKKLRKLEYYKDYTTLKKEGTNNGYYELQSYGGIPKKIPQIKHIDMTYSSPKDWSSMGDHGDALDQMSKQYIESHSNLESFKIQLIR